MIKLSDVFFSYNPKSPLENKVLKNLNFEIDEGKFTAIVGKTGCGKSTLIQMLNGLNLPTEGKINVDEFVVSKNKKERSKKLFLLKKKVGLVFQFSENQLFEETVEKDVAFGPINFGVKKEDALKIARESILNVGLDEAFFKRSPFELSGGEKRKVAIAGILALKPDYLVLDEPTVGLDNESAKALLKLLKELNKKGTSIVLVTHDMNLVFEYADEVIIIKDGEFKIKGKPEEILQHNLNEYDLMAPDIYKLCYLLKEKGLEINISSIKSIEDFKSVLKGVKK